MEIRNRTPLEAALNVVLDKRASEHLVVCVKGTWTLSERREPEFAAEQDSFQPADVHHGEPGLSSIKYEADLGPMKLATDCVLVGSARPAKAEASSCEVAFRAADCALMAKVVGAARGSGLMGAFQGTAPVGRLPLVWEYAVGGTDHTPEDPLKHSMDPRNPLGRGHRAKGSQRPKSEELEPQLLRPGKPSEPIGFGFMGAQWKARQQYAGTYDKVWQEERCPLLPLDFDERFFNSAPPELQQPGYLKGGERVEVFGCTRGGHLGFSLPRVSLACEAKVDGPLEPVAMELVTVTVDTDTMQLFLTWRGDLPIHRRLPLLQFVTLDARGLES